MSDHHILKELIRREIDGHGGWIPFARFMELALYAPGLGYYERERVFGSNGDFVTAADMGSWLACAIRDLVDWALDQLGRPSEWTLIEQGGGSGHTLVRVLRLLQETGLPMPARIIEVERSRWLRRRQAEHFAAHGFAVEQAASLAAVGKLENAVLFSNELPDAFPVRCFHWCGGQMLERGVACDEAGEFAWRDRPMDGEGPDIPPPLRLQWSDGYQSEWNPSLGPWQGEVAGCVGRGIVITVDYGYRMREYYRPGRATGTLMAHQHHQVVENVLQSPGSRDITAHVDFTALVRAGLQHGLQPLIWMPQGAWLAQSPTVQALVRELAGRRTRQSMAMLAHAKRLMLPFGMGETFKLLVQGMGIRSRPQYLERFDRLHTLEIGQGFG